MTKALHATDRRVLSVTGADAKPFLQGLVTNDMACLDHAPILYTALLSPQGKYLFDFFIYTGDEGFLLDVSAGRAEALLARLNMYRLRAAVTVSPSDMAVILSDAPLSDASCPDPRNASLGWRSLTQDPAGALSGVDPLTPDDILLQRVQLKVPETGVELLPDDSYILEMGFERLNGVDFKKGCYVGQEVTARMKHKTSLRKGLARVAIEGPSPEPGTPVQSEGRDVGTIHSVADGAALAYLRFDRAKGPMTAGTSTVRLAEELT